MKRFRVFYGRYWGIKFVFLGSYLLVFWDLSLMIESCLFWYYLRVRGNKEKFWDLFEGISDIFIIKENFCKKGIRE